VRATVDLAGRTLDDAMRIAAYTGSAWVLGPVAVALALWNLRRRDWNWVALVLAAAVLVWVINPALKRLFALDRPSVREFVEPTSRYAFPSGHAIASMTFATLVVLLAWPTRWRRPVIVGAVAYVLLVGTTRVVLGVHYPSDVLAGWALGMSGTAGLGAWLLVRKGNGRQDFPS